MSATVTATAAAFAVIPLGKHPVAVLQIVINTLNQTSPPQPGGHRHPDGMASQPVTDPLPGLVQQTIRTDASSGLASPRESGQIAAPARSGQMAATKSLTTLAANDGLHDSDPMIEATDACPDLSHEIVPANLRALLRR